MHLVTVYDSPTRIDFIAEIPLHSYFDFDKNAKWLDCRGVYSAAKLRNSHASTWK